MAFFDELSKRMKGVAQTAEKTAEIAKLQRQVSLKQDEFDELFKEIGQLYYTCHKRGEQPGEEMDGRCARVDSLAAEIEGLKLKLDDLRQIRRCPGCGSVQHTESKFCANCGAKLEERVVVEEEPAEAPAEPAEEAQEEAGKSVYINWPETGEKAEEGAEAAEEAEAPAESEEPEEKEAE